MSNTTVEIEHVQNWLAEHDEVHIENRGRFPILTANKHGDVQVGDASRPISVNITDPDVTVLPTDDKQTSN